MLRIDNIRQQDSMIDILDFEGVFLRGMPLLERMKVLEKFHPDAENSDRNSANEKIEDKWRELVNKNDKNGFQQLLDIYGTNENLFKQSLSIKHDDIKGWSIRHQIPEVDENREIPHWERKSAFAHICDDLIKPFLLKFTYDARQWCGHKPQILGSNPHHVFQLFAPALEFRIDQLVRKSAVLELNIARLRNELHGETPEERFIGFTKSLSTRRKQYQFLSEYAVIAYQCIRLASHWLDNGNTLLEHLCEDYSVCAERFFGESDIGILKNISWNSGDTHASGKSVCIIQMSSGKNLVYKPHSMATDWAFEWVVDFFNKAYPNTCLKHAKHIDRENHGWAEFIPSKPCSDHKEVKNFYWRQGVYLALFHILNTRDLHHENLIANGEFPVYVDLETLICLPGEIISGKHVPLALIPPLVSSLDVLPQQIWSRDSGKGMDFSALGGRPGQVLANAGYKFDASGTDEMRVVEGDITINSSSHLPFLDGEMQDLHNYKNYLLKGFNDSYSTILGNRHAFALQIEKWKNLRCRVVLRPTRLYGQLLGVSRHPDYMRDAVEREILFSCISLQTFSGNNQQINSEIRDLLNEDIPYFHLNFGNSCVQGVQDESVATLPVSLKDVLIRNLNSLSSQDQKIQERLLRTRLGMSSSHEDGGDAYKISVIGAGVNGIDDENEENRKSNIEKVIYGINRLLLDTGLKSEGRKLWPSPDLKDSEVLDLSFNCAIDRLYDGLPGIGLFYLKLYSESKSKNSLLVLENIVQSTLDWCSSRSEALENSSFFSGNTGVALFLIACGIECGDNKLINHGYHELLATKSSIRATKEWDVISGLAGQILALCDAHRYFGDTSLMAMIEDAASKLKSLAIEIKPGVIAWPQSDGNNGRPLAGFAHGSSGASAALALAGLVCHSDVFIKTAWQAIEYENTQFLEAAGNWRDNRVMERIGTHHRHSELNAWCHGAAGIGLARTCLLPTVETSLQETVLRRDFERVRNSSYLDMQGDCLCHGVIGNLLCARRIANAINDSEWMHVLEDEANKAVENIVHQGAETGLGGRRYRTLYPFNPALMHGLAGIGLGAIYLHQSNRMDCVLVGEVIGQVLSREGQDSGHKVV